MLSPYCEPRGVFWKRTSSYKKRVCQKITDMMKENLIHRRSTIIMMAIGPHDSKGQSHPGFLSARNCRDSTRAVYVRAMRMTSKCVATGSPETCRFSAVLNNGKIRPHIGPV
jgi:hypothetical protein